MVSTNRSEERILKAPPCSLPGTRTNCFKQSIRREDTERFLRARQLAGQERVSTNRSEERILKDGHDRNRIDSQSAVSTNRSEERILKGCASSADRCCASRFQPIDPKRGY